MAARVYDAVLFDAFNTLWHIKKPSHEMWQDALALMGKSRSADQIIEAERAERSWLQQAFQTLETRGTPTPTEDITALFLKYDVAVLARMGIKREADQIAEVIEDVFGDFNRLYPDTVHALSGLRQRGHRLAIVSNGPYQEDAATKLEIIQYFDTIIGSWHVGFSKPDPAIFRMALDRLDVTPDRAVMIGDTWEDDVEGARSAGIRGIHLRRNPDQPLDEHSVRDLNGLVSLLDREAGASTEGEFEG